MNLRVPPGISIYYKFIYILLFRFIDFIIFIIDLLIILRLYIYVLVYTSLNKLIHILLIFAILFIKLFFASINPSLVGIYLKCNSIKFIFSFNIFCNNLIYFGTHSSVKSIFLIILIISSS